MVEHHRIYITLCFAELWEGWSKYPQCFTIDWSLRCVYSVTMLQIRRTMFASHAPVFPTPRLALSGRSRPRSHVTGVWLVIPGRSSSGGCWAGGTWGWTLWNLWHYPLTEIQNTSKNTASRPLTRGKKKKNYTTWNHSTRLKLHHVQSICDHVEPSVVVTCLREQTRSFWDLKPNPYQTISCNSFNWLNVTVSVKNLKVTFLLMKVVRSNKLSAIDDWYHDCGFVPIFFSIRFAYKVNWFLFCFFQCL